MFKNALIVCFVVLVLSGCGGRDNFVGDVLDFVNPTEYMR